MYLAVELGFIFLYDTVNKNFIGIDHDFKSIKDFLIDRNDHIWMGGKHGVDFFDPKLNKTKHYNSFTGPKGKEYIGTVNTLMDEGDTLWIGTESGKVCCLLKKSGAVREFEHHIDDILYVDDIYKSSQKLIYITTTNGIYAYDKTSNNIEHYAYNKENPGGLNSYGVVNVFEDQQHNLWFGTAQGGVNIATSGKAFQNYNAFSNKITLDIVNINRVMEDDRENLWIGSYDNGINVINPTTGKNKLYLHDDRDPYSLGYGSVYAIFEDRSKTIWVGTYLGYLQRYDTAKDRFISYKFNSEKGGDKEWKDIRSIVQDNEGNLWIIFHGNGMAKFNPVSGKFKLFQRDINNLKESLPDNWAFQLLYDNENFIWIATPSGLSKFDPKTEKFHNFYNNKQDSTSHCSKIPKTICG